MAASVSAASFHAAAVKVDITPQSTQWLLGYGARQSTGVHDKLYHRIVVMDDGSAPFVLISTDIALFAPSFYDDFCRRLKQKTGIDFRLVALPLVPLQGRVVLPGDMGPRSEVNVEIVRQDVPEGGDTHVPASGPHLTFRLDTTAAGEYQVIAQTSVEGRQYRGVQRVQLEQGSPDVTVSLNGLARLTAVTDASGHFAFTLLPAGVFHLQVRATTRRGN